MKTLSGSCGEIWIEITDGEMYEQSRRVAAGCMISYKLEYDVRA
jgi:hypothetical protein